MSYRWKPNQAQREAYKAKMEEKEELNTFTTPHAIRTGCYIEYYNLTHGCVIKGEVTNHSYGSKNGQHTFTIDNIKVKGRNLYPNIIEHVQGKESLTLKIKTT